MLWDPSALGDLRLQLLVLFLLSLFNFYLQLQTLTRRVIPAEIVYAASAADIVVISLLVLVAQGLSSDVYVFYYPAILALSVAFATETSAVYALAAAGLYAVICLGHLSSGGALTNDNLQTLFARLFMIVAVAVCGNLYARIEDDRRKASDQVHDSESAAAPQAVLDAAARSYPD